MDGCLVYPMIVIRILLSTFVIYVSLAKLKADSMRNYTLNLYITACIPCDIAVVIQEVVTRCDELLSSHLSSVWIDMLMSIASSSFLLISVTFRVLSLCVVIILTLPYICPIFYHRNFANRSWVPYLIISDVVSCLFCVPSIALHFITFISIKCNFNESGRILGVVHGATDVMIFILAIATVSATVTATILLMKGAKAPHYSKRNGVQRKLLISFLLYTLPINVCNIPLYVSTIIFIVNTVSPHCFDLRLYELEIYAGYIDYFRTAIISLSTLIALPMYRNATVNLLTSTGVCKISSQTRTVVCVISQNVAEVQIRRRDANSSLRI